MSLWLWIAGCAALDGCGASPALPPITLRDQLGASHTLGGTAGEARVMVLVSHGIGCPIVRKSTPAIAALQARYGPEVALLWLNANPYNTAAAVAEEAADFGLDLPILLDPDQVVAGALGFTRTAETAVLETGDWSLAYFGALDDRLEYGMEKPSAQHHYARDAVDAVLAGEPVAVARTEAKGCALPQR